MRLIDADAITYHEEWKEEWLRNSGYYHQVAWKEEIDKLPTIEAEPKHGYWEWNDYGGFGNYHCTVCRFIPYVMFSRQYLPNYMYCPHCGAKMDGGKEDGEEND